MNRPFTDAERNFLHLVTRSIAANPFSAERREADARLSGLSRTTPEQLLLEAARTRVTTMIRDLGRHGRAELGRLQGEDRQLLANLYAFDCFHRAIHALDDHIQQQETTARPLPLSCGEAMGNDLARLGFTPVEADRLICLFFQMRRAFYFIRTSIIGGSPCMDELRIRLWNNLFTHDLATYVDLLWNRLEDFSTLLLGETGTGKGLVAAAIGRSGFIPYARETSRFTTSFTEAFIAINLSQFPEPLIESELFGHAKGAFTGAIRTHPGIFARSSPHGAVLLDEIGELSIPIQVKLLRILQERSFTPVGSQEVKRFGGRVIAATNRNLQESLHSGGFRADFYYRLSSDSIRIPSLRRRLAEDPEELTLLTGHLLTRITGRKADRILDKVLQRLQALGKGYRWPGNVRELEQRIRQILLHDECRPEPATERENKAERGPLFSNQPLTAAQVVASYCRHLYQLHGTLQEVARIAGLDRRTVKKYLELA